MATQTHIASRSITDASLSQSGTLPFAANTATTNYIDLGTVTPFPVTEQIGVRISATTGTQANNKNINIVLQHSDDTNTSNFANVSPTRVHVVTGNTTAVIANVFNVNLLPNVKRYIRGYAVGEANGGNSNDGTFTVQLMF